MALPLAAGLLRRGIRHDLPGPGVALALPLPRPAGPIGGGRQRPGSAGVAARLIRRRARTGIGVAAERARVERERGAARALRARLRRLRALLASRLPAR